MGTRALDTHTKLLAGGAAMIFLSMSLAMPQRFATAANLESMAFQASELGILSVAMTLALLTGGIDLSVTAIANLAAITAGLVLVPVSGAATPQLAAHIGAALLAALAVGLLCGLLNGVLIGRVGVPAILATLATLTLYAGLAFGITRGRAIHGMPAPVLYVGSGKFLGLPVPLLVFAGVVILMSVLLNRTAYGVRARLLGANATAARFAGFDNAAIALRTYALTGLLAAVAGMVSLARTNSANADYGSAYLLMSILVAVLGGVSVTGGSGRLAGVVLALAALQMLSTGFNMLLLRHSGSNFFRDFAWGALLLLAMVLTGRRRADVYRPSEEGGEDR